jgi:hypothetical protein
MKDFIAGRLPWQPVPRYWRLNVYPTSDSDNRLLKTQMTPPGRDFDCVRISRRFDGALPALVNDAKEP